MTKEILKEKLEGLIAQENCGMNLYFILRQQGEYILKKANVRKAALNPIKGLLSASIVQLHQMMEEETFMLMNLSGADERKSVIYQYDLGEDLCPISLMKEVENHLFEEDYFTSGNKVNLLKQGRNIFLIKDAEQMDILKNDLFRIDGKIDFFLLDNTALIFNISILEKFNDFKDIVIRSAQRAIQKITDVDLVSDITKLRERAESDISFARKLIKVTTNALILNVISNDIIIQFAQNHAYLSKRLKISADNKFEIDKKSAQNLFIQLLDDAFLHSDLSSNDYLSPGKDILRSEAIQNADQLDM